MDEPTIRLLPASDFTVEELTAAYNQTRVDYLVPMPMNAARLNAYIQNYNIVLEESVVAVDADDAVLGLGMLGVRDNHTWITRLGVLPNRRRCGTGEAIMRGLLAASERLGVACTILEVIKGNTAAHQLFRKLGFQETRELLILRRPPGKPAGTMEWRVDWLEPEDALSVMRSAFCQNSHEAKPAWTNEYLSLKNSNDVQGLSVELTSGARGWIVFRRQKFLLSHFLFYTEQGNSAEVAEALLSHLYQRFPLVDTYTENLSADDLHLPALYKMGFIEAFRRIEMEKHFGSQASHFEGPANGGQGFHQN